MFLDTKQDKVGDDLIDFCKSIRKSVVLGSEEGDDDNVFKMFESMPNLIKHTYVTYDSNFK